MVWISSGFKFCLISDNFETRFSKAFFSFKEGFLNIEYNGSISMTGPVSDIEKVRLKL